MIQFGSRSKKRISERIELTFGDADLGIDTLVGNIDTAEYFQRCKTAVELVAESPGVGDLEILVEGNCSTRLRFGQHTGFQFLIGDAVV